jgi:hypothetical protein
MSQARLQAIEIFGWAASLMILGAYSMTTLGILAPTDPRTHTLNLFGAIGIGTVTFVKKAYQSVLLNLVWAVVAAVGLLRVFIAF